MKQVFPVILTPDKTGYLVYIPDFAVNTEGESIEEALFMAQDAIGLAGVCLQDDGREIPSAKKTDYYCREGEKVFLVTVDFDEYRKFLGLRETKHCFDE